MFACFGIYDTCPKNPKSSRRVRDERTSTARLLTCGATETFSHHRSKMIPARCAPDGYTFLPFGSVSPYLTTLEDQMGLLSADHTESDKSWTLMDRFSIAPVFCSIYRRSREDSCLRQGWTGSHRPARESALILPSSKPTVLAERIFDARYSVQRTGEIRLDGRM